MIYKREPQYQNLPTGWQNMDAVKYNNLFGIKGLQHTDNSLSADQNSTYSCKNVYQDESGNITVRPALRYSGLAISTENEVLGIYKTSFGYLYHLKDATGPILIDDVAHMLRIGRGNVTVQESDGKIYVMYTDIDGMLQFKEWDMTGVGLLDIDPAILPNSPLKPISRLYNLLTDKTKYEVTPVIPKNVANSLFTEFVVTSVTKDSEALAYSILKNGYLILVYSYAIVIGTPYGTAFKFSEIPVNIEFNPDCDEILIEDTADVDCKVNVLTVVGTKYTRTEYTLNFAACSKTYKTWTVSMKDVLCCKLGYDDSLFFAYAIADKLATSLYTIAVDWYRSGASTYAFDYTSWHAADSVTELAANLAVSKTSLVLKLEFRPNDDKVVYLHAIDFDYWKSRPTENTGKYYSVINKGTASNANFIALRSGYDNWYVIDFIDPEITKIYTELDYYRIKDGKQDGSKVTVDPVILDRELDSPRTFTGTNEALIVYTGIEYLAITTDSQRIYEFADSTETIDAVFNYDSTVVIEKLGNTFNIYTRELLPQYVETSRPVSDSFPVLSEISDEVVTSFYLDNIYWFVTKHRVFGTGVAEEQFTIKYFDPMKYFHFDETITAAIRISDSSFWVFHNNGAYLIYKSSSQIYDETSGDYVETITWLCTSTAESKGCDFENAVLTLPVSNYVSCVTSDDISIIQMRENVQTDDRILVPMTLDVQKFVSGLLNETESVVPGIFKYNALYFLNPANKSKNVKVMVYNAVTQSWWYWELPVNKVLKTFTTETTLEMVAYVKDTEGDTAYRIYDLYTEYFNKTIGGVTWELYADRVDSVDEPVKIEWYWESAIMHFGSADHKKQLLFTNFAFGERESSTINFEYNFEVYDREYSDRTWSEVNQVIERARTYSCKTPIAKFMYLQLYLKSMAGNEFETYTRPKFSSITFKYRILPGGLL